MPPTPSSTALVPANPDNVNATTNGTNHADADLPVDLSQLPMIPMAKTLVLVNNFVANTTRFLNRFAFDCEDRLARVSSHLTRVEIMLAILEAKLNSVPDLTVSDEDLAAVDRDPLAPEATTSSIGIDQADLPSTEAAQNGVLPPPPPPPPGDGGVPAPPPPPPTLGQETSTALVVAEEGALEVSGAGQDGTGEVLKLKDDPRYATYFTMQRHQIPRIAIEQKMKMDGVDISILDMDPEGPSPSAGGGMPVAAPAAPSDGGISPPPPPPPSLNVDPMSIPMPFPPPDHSLFSPSSSVSSEGPPESLFGTSLPPPPPMQNPPPPTADDVDDSSSDENESATGTGGYLKLKDDPVYAKYFKMMSMGAPEGAIRQKLLMDGVTVDILSMDPEGPSPSPATPEPTNGANVPPPPPRAAAPGLPPLPAGRYEDSDDDDSDF